MRWSTCVCLSWFNTFKIVYFRIILFFFLCSFFDWFRWEITESEKSNKWAFIYCFLSPNYSSSAWALPKINSFSTMCGHEQKKIHNKNKKCDCKSIDKRYLRWLWFFGSFRYSKICRHISCALSCFCFSRCVCFCVFFYIQTQILPLLLLLFFTPENILCVNVKHLNASSVCWFWCW